MRIGNKDWSGAPGTIAREVQSPEPLAVVESEVKGVQFIPEDASLYFGHFSTGTIFSYLREVGSGLDSNVVMAPVMWIMRNFTEATARVQGRRVLSVVDGETRYGPWRWKEDHPLEVLLSRPNEGYNGDALWKATCVSYILDGNAYWWKIRNVMGEVIQLWYLPHWLVTPRWPRGTSSTFISHYEYRPMGGADPVDIRPRDMVHFRFGLDPVDPRRGISPLKVLLREVYVDDEAQNFSARILKNMGVPGLLISPDGEKFRPTDTEVVKLKAYMQTAFSGQNMGKPMVMQVPTKVQQFGFDANKLMLGALRNIAEERVCSVIGIPPEVVGFGAGSESTHVGATMREKRRMAWVAYLTPTQKSMAKELDAQLLPDFQVQLRRFRVRFDTSDVAAYQEDDDALAQRVGTLAQAGILRLDRAQEEMGLEVDENRKVYYQPANVVVIGEDGKPVEPPKPAGPVPGTGDDQVPDPVAARMNGSRNGRRRGGRTTQEEEPAP